MTVQNHVDAAYPLLMVEAADEMQVVRDVQALEDIQSYIETGEGKRGAVYSATGKLRPLIGIDDDAPSIDYIEAFDMAAAEPMVLIVYDLQHFIEDASFYRHLIEISRDLKEQGSTIIMIAPDWSTKPAELLHNAPIISFGLPTRDQLVRAAVELCEDNPEPLPVPSEEELIAIGNAAAGLTLEEAENAYALSITMTGAIDPKIVQGEKMRLIQGTGYMSVHEPVDPDSIGGLSVMKEYLAEMKEAEEDPQLKLRGFLACGLNGNGKSMIAKATGAMFGLPVVGLSLTECRGGIVGESEKNLKNAFRLAEAVAPCVLWLDEIDKSVGGHKSSAETDGGTGLGMLGQLLTWLQEHKAPIITVATCNLYDALPPALKRPGRFDERFFVDLPTHQERREIARIHFDRLSCEFTGGHIDDAAKASEGWTGAEIEELCKRTARISKRNIESVLIERAARSIKPSIETDRAEITRQREEYGKLLRKANTPEEPKQKGGRKIKALATA